MPNIAVIDDEKDIRQFLKLFLEDNGHTVQTAEDGKQGLVLLESFQADLVVLDIIMPCQSGLHLFKTMRKSKRLKNIPVIVLSAVSRYRENMTNELGTPEKPDAFVDKPFDQDKLLKLIDTLIGKKG